MQLACALARVEKLVEAARCDRQNVFLIAIDGRCAAGKTTFAKYLAKHLQASVIAMDDFFLSKAQRANMQEDYNFDCERFLKEVIAPLRSKNKIMYRVFDCHTQSFQETKQIEYGAGSIIIIEGAYVLHPRLRDFWDLCLFIDVDKDIQSQRIQARNGNDAKNFFTKWIPLEEDYLQTYQILDFCDDSFYLEDDCVE